MKQKITLSILAVVCAIFSARAVIQVTGYTVWTNPNITDDININPGGTLDIQNLNVNVLPGKQIYVQDGGRIYGNNGTLSCEDGLWRGIEVEPTSVNNPSTQIAVQLFNFEITKAEIAIRSGVFQTTGVHNQKIYLSSVKFNNNNVHIWIQNNVNNFSGSALLGELSQMIHSTVYAYRCSFLETNSGGDDVYLAHLYRPKLVECYFSGTPGPIGACVQWRGCHKGLITRCDFRENRQIYIVLDFNGNDDTRIHDNNFNLYNIDIWRAGIFAPLWGGTSYLFKNLSITGNTFWSPDNNQDEAIGVHIGDYWSGSNNIKYENLTISKNHFSNIQRGVDLAKSVGESNIIESNVFSNCEVGCYFQEDNLGVTIECNTFEWNTTDIHIAQGAELQNQDWLIDNGNTWSVVDQPNVNIINDGSIVFEYHFNANLPVVQGPVTLLAVMNNKDCSGGGGGGGSSSMNTSIPYSRKQGSTIISMSPNPAVDIVSYEIRDISIDEIVVTSLTGEIVLRVNVQDVSSGQLDVSKFKAGIYICNYINQAGTQHQERLMITN